MSNDPYAADFTPYAADFTNICCTNQKTDKTL